MPFRNQLYVVLAGALCYANALGNGFVFDDAAYIGSPLVRQFDPLAAFGESWIRPDLYRPLTLLSLGLDFRLYGEQPFGYHLSSVLLHLLNALLVHQLALRLLTRRGAALGAALFYAVHPLQTEVVTWISSRGDLLMSSFFLAGLLCHMRAERGGWRVLAWILCGLGALSKESGFVLPAVAWCHDALLAAPKPPLRQLPAFTLAWLRRHWGYGLVLVLVLALRWQVAAEGPASANFLADAEPAARLMTLPVILLRYLLLIVFPLRLSADYSHASIPLVQTPLDPLFPIAVVALGALLYIPFRAAPLPAFIAAYSLLALLPASNFLVLAPSGMAERYLHPVMPALALLCGLAVRAGSDRLRTPARRNAGRAFAAAALLLLAARTVDRNPDWASDHALFSAVLAVYPDNARACDNLAHCYYRRGHTREAIAYYKRAIAIAPDRVRTHYNLGLLYNAAGRHRKAIQAFAGALRLNPDHAGAHYNAGLAHQKIGRPAEAVGHYRQTLRLDVDHARAAFNLGRAYQQLDQPRAAIEAFATAVALDPRRLAAHYHLGQLYRATGDFARMAEAWNALLQLDPDHREAARLRQLLNAHKSP